MQGVNEPAMADPWADLANNQGYQGEVQAAQPRPLRVPSETSQASSSAAATPERTPKRQVSSNACQQCRRRKSKCDGLRPRCTCCAHMQYPSCVYDIDKDLRRKGALRLEIQRLKKDCQGYQFVIDSLCVAEGPQLIQLVQLIRSLHSIDAIAASLQSGNFASNMDPLQAVPMQLQAAPMQLQVVPMPTLGGINNEGHNFGDSRGGPQFLEMGANQNNINFNHSNVLNNQTSINISGSNIQINPTGVGLGVPMSGVSSMAGIPEMPVVLGVSGVQVGVSASVLVQQGQLGVPQNQSMNMNVNANMNAFSTSAEQYQRAPPDQDGGWYDDWELPWPAF